MDRPLLTGLRILVVENDQESRMLLRTFLGLYGAEVTAVASVNEAVEWIDPPIPHVVLTDVKAGNPHSLIQQIRQKGREWTSVPALALTVVEPEEFGNQILSAGYQAYVAKPVDPQTLLSLVVRLSRLGK